MYVTLSEAKKHLNISDEWFTEDDAYILDLIKVCENVVEKRLGKPLKECVLKDGELDPSVKHSILVLIGTYYNQREATSPANISTVPYTFDFLADLNKRYHF